MITILKTTPAIGVPIQVNVVYRSGFVEIINDSPFQLQASLPTGQTTLVAGYVYAFPIGDGGMFFQLLPTGYLTQNTTVNLVTVNSYQDGDGFNPSAYPLTIVRSTPLPVTNFTVLGAATLGSGFITLNLPLPGAGQRAYITSFTLTADRSPVVQSCNLNILNSINASPMTYVLTQQVEAGLVFSQNYNPGLIDINTNPLVTPVAMQVTVNNINLTLSGSTAQLVVTGYIQ